MIDFSHIRARSAGGDDSEENGLALCRWHHTHWHSSRTSWWMVYSSRLRPDDQQKILAVYPEFADTPDTHGTHD